MKTSTVLLFSALVFGPVANATVAPLPTGAVENNRPITVTDWIGQTNGGGGVFGGTVSVYQTAFWCVDDQTYFYWTNSSANAHANITLLSGLSGPAISDTWYGSANPGWTDTSVGLAPAIDDVQHRLLMAAYLVQQYGGYDTPFTGIYGTPASPGGTPPTGALSNDAIQEAIWTLTNNSFFENAPVHSNVPGYSAPNDLAVKYWLAEAAQHYQTAVDPTKWAVVSWVAPVPGSSNPYQTFLVAVTPEPGSYGALALGMSGLALMIARKRKLS